MRHKLVLACALLLCVATGSASTLSPEQVCAQSRINARYRLSDTRFVACYNQQVWSTGTCSNLRFDSRSQTCVPA